MRNDELRKLKELPIEGVALRLGMEVRNHKTLCVFHKDSRPSLHFSPQKNVAHCFSCSTSADTIALVMKVRGVGFLDACRWLKKEYSLIISGLSEHNEGRQGQLRKVKEGGSVNITYLKQLMERPRLSALARHFLVDERKISMDVVRKTGISSIERDISVNGGVNGPWFNAPALLIPYRDERGELVNVQARYLGTEKKQRFQFPAGSRCGIFNLPQLTELKDGDNLYISEGPTDCLALLSSGRKAIGIASATTFSQKDKETIARLVARTVTLHVYPDNDNAGSGLYAQLMSMATDLGFCIIRHDLPEGCKDFGQAYSKFMEDNFLNFQNHKG